MGTTAPAFPTSKRCRHRNVDDITLFFLRDSTQKGHREDAAALELAVAKFTEYLCSQRYVNVSIRHALCPLNSPLDADRACFCTTHSCASALKPDAPDSLVDLAMFPTDSRNDPCSPRSTSRRTSWHPTTPTSRTGWRRQLRSAATRAVWMAWSRYKRRSDEKLRVRDVH